MPETSRCPWCGEDPLMVSYHDEEWGVPLRDDRALYEKLCLDGFQAGLSWMIVLRKRENFLKAFSGFDPEHVARYGPRQVRRLLGNAGIIRSRAKIEAAISNARAWLTVMEGIGFSELLWRHVDGKPLVNRWKADADIPTKTPASEALARDLKRHGFSFCGPTICYAFMQATGMVNDHLTGCFRHAELAG